MTRTDARLKALEKQGQHVHPVSHIISVVDCPIAGERHCRETMPLYPLHSAIVPLWPTYPDLPVA